MFCPKCGSEVEDNANFCTSCGHALKNDTKVEKKEEAGEKQPLKVKSKNKKETAPNIEETEPYFSEKESWIFTGAVSVMLVIMTVWAFSVAN